MLGAEPVSHIEMKEAHLNLASFKLGGSMLEFLEGAPAAPSRPSSRRTAKAFTTSPMKWMTSKANSRK
jgi:hypothetical protein